MTLLLSLILPMLPPVEMPAFPPPYDPPAHYAGYLSAYDQRPTDATLAYRQSVGDVPLYIDDNTILIAVLDCRHVGENAVLWVSGTPYNALVFDCAHGDSWDWMLGTVTGIPYVAEIDYYTRISRPEIVGTWATLEIVE